MRITQKILNKKAKKNISTNEITIRNLLKSIDIEEALILDEKNAIIITSIESNDDDNYQEEKNLNYIMSHVQLKDQELQFVSQWNMDLFYYGILKRDQWLKDLKLFKIWTGRKQGLYDYTKGKFIIPLNDWDTLLFGNHKEYIKKYKGILATFELTSEFEKGDVFTYINPVTSQSMIESFKIQDKPYFAILNFDGSIRGNKLFYGNDFSKIEDIIDLNHYDSLQDFKKQRKAILTNIKREKKLEYEKRLKSKQEKNLSPYLDDEVYKIVFDDEYYKKELCRK